jgi:hypothetical protein
VQEEIIKCSNCNKDLVHLITDGSNSIYQLRVHCLCGDHSWYIPVSRRFFLQGLNCEIGQTDYNEDKIEVYVRKV